MSVDPKASVPPPQLSALSSTSMKAVTDSGLKRFSPRVMRITTHSLIFSISIFLSHEVEGVAHRIPGPAHTIMDRYIICSVG